MAWCGFQNITRFMWTDRYCVHLSEKGDSRCQSTSARIRVNTHSLKVLVIPQSLLSRSRRHGFPDELLLVLLQRGSQTRSDSRRRRGTHRWPKDGRESLRRCQSSVRRRCTSRIWWERRLRLPIPARHEWLVALTTIE